MMLKKSCNKEVNRFQVKVRVGHTHTKSPRKVVIIKTNNKYTQNYNEKE